jgi:putative membrane protein
MYYDGYHFLGMHLIWWLVWSVFAFWIFATPYAIPGQRKRNFSPLEILQNRFAKGEISARQFEEDKNSLTLKE